MQDNNNDQLAALAVGTLTPIRLRTFFPKNIGPNVQHLQNKGSASTNALAKEADALIQLQLKQKKDEVSAANQAEQALAENATTRKREAAAKTKPATPPAKKHRTIVGTFTQTQMTPPPE